MFSTGTRIEASASSALASRALPAHFDSAVMIVEDDESIRGALNALLESYSVYVNWAGSGAEALDQLEQLTSPPKLVIVDGRLPDLHGLELIRDLRQRLPADTELYLFSADTVAEPQALARSGVNGFLRKPFDTDRLIDLAVRFATVE